MSEENREVAQVTYTNIQYLINMGVDSPSNTHIYTHTHTYTHIRTNGKTDIRVNASQHGRMYKELHL